MALILSLSESKVCSTCEVELPIASFYKKKGGKFGVRAVCKTCSDKEHLEYARTNAKELRAYLRKRYAENPVSRRESAKQYAAAHKKEKLAYQTKYQKHKMATDLDYRLRTLLRGRLSKALTKGYKKGSAVSDLGCTIQHLKLHLELFWDEGMSWYNYGKGEGQWSIDHIKPLASFDLTDRAQLLQAVHYTNLQPLWHVDNMRKHASEGSWR